MNVYLFVKGGVELNELFKVKKPFEAEHFSLVLFIYLPIKGKGEIRTVCGLAVLFAVKNVIKINWNIF